MKATISATDHEQNLRKKYMEILISFLASSSIHILAKLLEVKSPKGLLQGSTEAKSLSDTHGE